MSRYLLGGIALTPLALGAAPAWSQVLNANVDVSTQLSTVAQSSAVSLLDLGTSGTNGLVGNSTISFGDGTISFTGKGGVYSGNVTGVSAAPFTATGPQTSNYFAAEPSGAVTISYNNTQRYFGVMWGSVDTYNTLSFYQGGTLVEQLTGKNIVNNPTGDQGVKGTYMVNVNFNNTASFDRVVFGSSTPAFEFNLVAYSATTQAITPTQQLAVGPQSGPTVVKVNAAPAGASPLIALAAAAWRRRRRRSRA